jgi:hypothetical protein
VKTLLILRSATMVLSLGIGSAWAGDGDGAAANTLFTEIPGVVAQPRVQSVPSSMTAHNGLATHAYVTRSQPQGVWLFAPNPTGGGANQ